MTPVYNLIGSALTGANGLIQSALIGFSNRVKRGIDSRVTAEEAVHNLANQNLNSIEDNLAKEYERARARAAVRRDAILRGRDMDLEDLDNQIEALSSLYDKLAGARAVGADSSCE